MKQLELSREVGAPAPVVWEVLTDLEASPRFVSGIESVERLDDATGFGVGTRWRETRTMFGREATEEMTVTVVDDGRAYTVEADNRGTRYVSTMAVEEAGAGRSRVAMTFGAEPHGAVARVLGATLGRLFEGPTRTAMQQDLDDIAAEAERRAG